MMGFAMGCSSCFLHTPIHNSVFSNPSSQPFSSFTCPRYANGRIKQKYYGTAMACMHQEHSKDSNSSRRKAILFLGISVLPLLNIKAQAAESSAQVSQDQKQRGDAPSNPFLSLLNGLGIFGAGVLGALYASAQKEKASLDATIESMSSKLKEKEASIVSMQKKFEAELLNEKDIRNKESKRASEDRQSLVNQLTSANDTIRNVEQELQKEKLLANEFKAEIDSLQNNLRMAGEYKMELEKKLQEKLDSIEVLQGRINLLSSEVKNKEENLHRLGSVLAEKEEEFSSLSSSYEQSQVRLKGLESEMIGLKDELLKYKTELELKNVAVNDLNKQVASLDTERDEMNQKLEAIQIQYNELKQASEKKAASDAELLEQMEKKLNQLEEQLKFAHEEINKNEGHIADLTRERNYYKEMLDIELNNVKNLENDLQNIQVTLEKSKDEASSLEKERDQSRNLCSELETELFKVRAEFAEARESLQKNLDKGKQDAEFLADEVASAKELQKKTNEELQVMSDKLAAVSENRDNLQKELADAFKNAETAIHDLNEERKNTASLNKQLKMLEAQILKDKESRRSLEGNLDEATKSLDEMNKNALALSKDLELANSRIYSLEDEKDVLYKSLDEQKQISKEARENLEDAHNLVMRLGKERESLEKKAQKLEEELASAKGEILRLRSQTNSSRTPVNSQQEEKVEADNKEVVPSKKTTRRRKA